MTDNHQPGFERPDLDELRHSYHRPSMWSRFLWSAKGFLRSRSTIDLILLALIIAVLLIGYWALF